MIDEIIMALVAFEVVGDVRIVRMFPDIYEITVNGRYFGIWNAQRKTFVD